jgi:hypothetical protein
MAESAAQKRLQELQAERRRAAYRIGKSESGGSGITVAPAVKPESAFHEGSNVASSGYWNKRQEKPLTSVPNRHGKSGAAIGSAKVYQKHVLFALVGAFLIKMVANGKLSAK